jgi:aspartate carbamoyltransferase regulatory subunit
MVSENAIEANYQLPDNEAVKIKVFFNDVPKSERLNLLESGITLHTKSGNEPIVLNVSSDQISKSKLIKISNTFFTK